MTSLGEFVSGNADFMDSVEAILAEARTSRYATEMSSAVMLAAENDLQLTKRMGELSEAVMKGEAGPAFDIALSVKNMINGIRENVAEASFSAFEFVNSHMAEIENAVMGSDREALSALAAAATTLFPSENSAVFKA